MGALEYIIGSVLILFALIIIFVVLLQEGRQANVGVISGAADSFMDKGAAKSLDQKLSKLTKWIAIIFFVLVLGGMLFTNIKGEPETTVPSEGMTNDAELDFSGEGTADKKDEDKKEDDKKEESDKKEDADKKDDADHDHDH